jgi:hypothetical protein
MQAQFKYLSFKSFPMILGTPQSNGFWPLQSLSEDLGIQCDYNYHNPNLGLATKARACKVVGQEKKPGSERKYEGMNPHTPKGAPTLGAGVLVDSRMFKE